MEKIKIKKQKKYYDIKRLERTSSHILLIEFDSDIPETFGDVVVYTAAGYKCAEIPGFSTVYRAYENTVELSDDGSVYVEPEPEPEAPDTPIEPYVPTLEEVKESKIRELSSACEQAINTGVEYNGKQYSYKLEDQTPIKTAAEMSIATGLDSMWHSDNGSCEIVPAEDMVGLYIAQETNRTAQLTYFNQMKMYINTLEDKDIISNIKYGDALTGSYLDTYNTIMQQAEAIIQTYVNKIKGSETGETA